MIARPKSGESTGKQTKKATNIAYLRPIQPHEPWEKANKKTHAPTKKRDKQQAFAY